MRADAFRPLPPSFPLFQLIAMATPGTDRLLGGWVRGGSRPLRLSGSSATPLLAAGDLRYLLARCDLVAVRSGERVLLLRGRPLESRLALQVAAARSRVLLPGVFAGRFDPVPTGTDELTVPVGERTPEAVLADCVRDGLSVRASRVVRFD